MRMLKLSETGQVSGGVSFAAGGAALGTAIGDIIGYNANLVLKFIPGMATIQEVTHIGPDYIKENISASGEYIGRNVGEYIDTLLYNK